MVRTTRISSETAQSRAKSIIQDGRPGSDGDNSDGLSSATGTPKTSRRSPTATGHHSKLAGTPRQLPAVPTSKKESPPKQLSQNKLTQNKLTNKESAQKPMCTNTQCDKAVNEEDQAVFCNKCTGWTHRSCAGFTMTDYKILTKKGKYQANLMWFSEGCVPIVNNFLKGTPSPNTSKKVHVSRQDKEATDEINKKLEAVIDGFKRVEKSLAEKENRLEDLIEEKVTKYLKRERRQGLQFNLSQPARE